MIIVISIQGAFNERRRATGAIFEILMHKKIRNHSDNPPALSSSNGGANGCVRGVLGVAAQGEIETNV